MCVCVSLDWTLPPHVTNPYNQGHLGPISQMIYEPTTQMLFLCSFNFGDNDKIRS